MRGNAQPGEGRTTRDGNGTPKELRQAENPGEDLRELFRLGRRLHARAQDHREGSDAND